MCHFCQELSTDNYTIKKKFPKIIKSLMYNVFENYKHVMYQFSNCQNNVVNPLKNKNFSKIFLYLSNKTKNKIWKLTLFLGKESSMFHVTNVFYRNAVNQLTWKQNKNETESKHSTLKGKNSQTQIFCTLRFSFFCVFFPSFFAIFFLFVL